MSEKREFPILNGKLLSDLDLNGHKLLGLNIPEGGGGGGGGGASVEVVAPSADGEGKAADAKAVYEELKKKQDTLSDTQTAAVNSGITAKKVEKLDGVEAGAQKNPDLSAYAKTAEVPAAIAGKEIKPSGVVINPNFDSIEPFVVDGRMGNAVKRVYIRRGLNYLGLYLESEEEDYHTSSATLSCEGITVSHKDIRKGTYYSFAIDVTEGTVTYKDQDNVEGLSNTIANMVNPMPRYSFVDAAIVDGVVTVAPYTNAKIASDGTAFTVAVGEGGGYARDCVLRVECGETAPKITWGKIFHPRTDAETDFKCEAGKRNVYWITEHAEGEFCVAGWQETTGGGE